MANLLVTLLQLYVFCIFGRIILSWFPVTPGGPVAQISSVLYSITEPVLGPIRNVLPSIGMFDLSPMVVIFAVNLVLIPVIRSTF
ncbi:MAG TPA: YggT family protein [Acidimicrobiales bacterium]|nr:YggT family protein [Acidimicrobiales bacterium]